MPNNNNSNACMTDKELMQTLLNTTKGACDLYLHGSIESSTKNVHSTMNTVLDDTLCMQNEIYTQMSQKGWYPSQNADQTQIQQTKSKYSQNA